MVSVSSEEVEVPREESMQHELLSENIFASEDIGSLCLESFAAISPMSSYLIHDKFEDLVSVIRQRKIVFIALQGVIILQRLSVIRLFPS